VISRSRISPNALRVLYRLRDAGFMAFLVGGCVRDLLLGIEPKDFDVATDALPEQVKRRVMVLPPPARSGPEQEVESSYLLPRQAHRPTLLALLSTRASPLRRLMVGRKRSRPARPPPEKR